MLWTIGFREPLPQLRPAPFHLPAPDGILDSFLLAYQHDQPLATGDPCVEQVASQHGVVLRHDRDDHSGILRPL